MADIIMVTNFAIFIFHIFVLLIWYEIPVISTTNGL